MKILIDHNESFCLAHGGFQILIEKTAEALRGEGVEVEYLRWWDPDQKGDLIHFFGRANPGSIHFAHGKGMKYVMHELLTSQGSRSKNQLRLQGLANKILRKVLPTSFRLPLRWDSYQMADAVIASTKWEAWIMHALFDVPPDRLHVVPTGVDEEFFADAKNSNREWRITNSEKEGEATGSHQSSAIRHPLSAEGVQSAIIPSPSSTPYLVTVATITERKRVVELAEAAIIASVPLLVVGKPYSIDDPYYLKFLKIVQSSGGLVVHRDDLSAPEDLAPALQSARGFVLLSTMETQSTAALAAAAVGCPLLLSDLPWARETFGSNATYMASDLFAPGKANMAAAVLSCFYSNASNLKDPPRPTKWSEVAIQLVEIYHSLGCSAAMVKSEKRLNKMEGDRKS